MAWQKVNEVSTAILLQAFAAEQISDDLRIVWRNKNPEDNIIFLASDSTLIDMIENTVKPDDRFEIWQTVKKNNLKD